MSTPKHKYALVDQAVGKALPPMSREDFRKDIDTAEQEIADGNYKKAEDVFQGLEQRYGF